MSYAAPAHVPSSAKSQYRSYPEPSDASSTGPSDEEIYQQEQEAKQQEADAALAGKIQRAREALASNKTTYRYNVAVAKRYASYLLQYDPSHLKYQQAEERLPIALANIPKSQKAIASIQAHLNALLGRSDPKAIRRPVQEVQRIHQAQIKLQTHLEDEDELKKLVQSYATFKETGTFTPALLSAIKEFDIASVLNLGKANLEWGKKANQFDAFAKLYDTDPDKAKSVLSEYGSHLSGDLPTSNTAFIDTYGEDTLKHFAGVEASRIEHKSDFDYLSNLTTDSPEQFSGLISDFTAGKLSDTRVTELGGTELLTHFADFEADRVEHKSNFDYLSDLATNSPEHFSNIISEFTAGKLSNASIIQLGGTELLTQFADFEAARVEHKSDFDYLSDLATNSPEHFSNIISEFTAGKLSNASITQQLSLIHISEPTRPY